MGVLYNGHSNQSYEVSVQFLNNQIVISATELNESIFIDLDHANITFMGSDEISLYHENFSLKIFKKDFCFYDLHKELSKKKKRFLGLSFLGVFALFGLLYLLIDKSSTLVDYIPDKAFELMFDEEQFEKMLGSSLCIIKPEVASEVLRDFGVNENYQLKILSSSMVNAFAYPKRTIIFTDSLLKKLDDDEFRAILGHEIGHHYYAHYKPAIVRAFILNFFIGSSQTPSIVANFLTRFLGAKHSQDAERQSDLHSAQLMKAAGIDLSANITAMRKISANAGESRFLSIMSTHPLTEDRIKFFEKMKDYSGRFSKSRELIEKINKDCMPK